MDGLDFSDVTDDQLIELARACCVEALRRSPAAASAMQDMMVSEAERARIAKLASEDERRAARALERERIAKEARARAKHDEDMRTASARADDAKAAADRAREISEQSRHAEMGLLRQAAALTREKPSDISILHCQTSHGRRLIINPGADRFSRRHLVDYNVTTTKIRTTAALVPMKSEAAAFCAAAAATLPLNTFIAGAGYTWED